MSSTKSKENRLFLTNNYSILSKYSASIKGYFKDPILEDLIQNETQDGNNHKHVHNRTSLVNRGYAARQMAVEWIVDRSIRFERVDCIIILGAGFDTLSLRPRPSAQCHWIEIDLPYVVEFKCKYINTRIVTNQNDVIISDDGKVTSFMALKLHLISCDIRDQEDLSKKLSLALANIHPNERKRVAVLNEVCLCYLEQSEIRQIFETLKQLVSQSATAMHYIGFEQVKPHDTSQFAHVMLNHFEYIGFSLKNFPTRRELLDLFMNQLNFNHMLISSMYQIYHNANFESRLSSSTLEPFDEYEELDSYLSHYALVTGVIYLRPIAPGECSGDPTSSNGVDRAADALYDDLCSRINMIQLGKQQQTLSMEFNESINRYGHSSCVLVDQPDSKVALVSGGFGKYANHESDIESANNQSSKLAQHQRLNECIAVGWDSSGVMQTRRLQDNFVDELGVLGRMHGQICNIGDDLVFFNGGRRSPQRFVNLANDSYIGQVQRSDLTLKCITKVSTNSSLRWRHRTLKFQHDKLIQVGGLRANSANSESAIGVWHLSSDRCDFVPTLLAPEQESLFDRHTFGMDLRDENTLLVFGGLMASGLTDHPVDASHGVMLFDFRSPNSPTKVDCLRQSYDAQVHFLDANQFVKMGGISNTTGLPEEFVELYDLRGINKNNGLPISSKPFPSVRRDANCIFIPTKMTSVHFKQSHEIISIGGGGNYFTFGTHFNEWHLRCKYSQL
uniref:tRNA wybutosine-synthesizing protein 4 n=1 Tax=Aceria tosichella TaxID=561515 RepID=A0A6G1SE25_9ACAR